jgi:glucose repression regulatory protein TUP1
MDRPLGSVASNTAVGPPVASNGGPGSGGTGNRLGDLLDFVRQEFDAVSGEAQNLKLQNGEYENHGADGIWPSPAAHTCPAHGQIKEVTALRHNLMDLEREHQKLKDQFVIANGLLIFIDTRF